MLARATEEKVINAIKELKEQGQEPTPTAIRKITGGSMSTIYNLLKKIREKNDVEQIESEQPEIDDIINDLATEFVKKIYDTCKDRADKIAAARCKSRSIYEGKLMKMYDILDKIEESYQTKKESYEKHETAFKEMEQNYKNTMQIKNEEIESLKKTVEILQEQLKATNELLNKLSKDEKTS